MELLNLALIGAVVTTIVQVIKQWAGTEGWVNVAIVAAISLLGGAVYFFLKDSRFWESFVQILAFAGAIYTYLIQRFQAE